MKKNIAFCCLLFAIACASPDAKKEDSVLAEKPSAPADPTGVVIEETDAKLVDTTKKSIKAYASNTINGIKCVINYHSPAVRGRQVWGGLVPYNQPWVGGAHMATSLEVGSDFVPQVSMHCLLYQTRAIGPLSSTKTGNSILPTNTMPRTTW
jgi:hypothetical protein